MTMVRHATAPPRFEAGAAGRMQDSAGGPARREVANAGGGHEKAPASLARSRGSAGTAQTEAEGLEPPKAFARRISSAVPYQLDYASPETDISRDGRI